ncbi:hypothetical protein MUU53_11790, partial [Rhizobium lemnae]|uniref:hypothetical protein n=1 Tax=Rhizobium lemnae TaxID=1214924 RepID=UPI001FF5CB40
QLHGIRQTRSHRHLAQIAKSSLPPSAIPGKAETRSVFKDPEKRRMKLSEMHSPAEYALE